jgi:hypothetical protein
VRPPVEWEEWEDPHSLSRSHRVDELEELRLRGHGTAYQQQSRDRAHIYAECQSEKCHSTLWT